MFDQSPRNMRVFILYVKVLKKEKKITIVSDFTILNFQFHASSESKLINLINYLTLVCQKDCKNTTTKALVLCYNQTEKIDVQY